MREGLATSILHRYYVLPSAPLSFCHFVHCHFSRGNKQSQSMLNLLAKLLICCVPLCHIHEMKRLLNEMLLWFFTGSLKWGHIFSNWKCELYIVHGVYVTMLETVFDVLISKFCSKDTVLYSNCPFCHIYFHFWSIFHINVNLTASVIQW